MNPTWLDSSLRRLLVLAVCLKVAGLVVIFDFTRQTIAAFDLPKSVFSRGTEWILVALLGIALVRFGAGIVPRSPLVPLIGGYVLVVAASGFVAADPYLALFGTGERMLGLTFVVDMAVLALAVAASFRERSDWARAAIAVGAAAGIAIAYAVIQALGGDPLAWSEDPRERPFATLGNPDMLGAFLTVAFAIGTGCAALASRPSKRAVHVGGSVLAVASLLALAAVGTRSSLLGVAGGLAALAFAYLRVRGIGRASLVRVGTLGIAAVAILFAVLAFSTLGDRIVATLSGVQTQDRVLIYRSALAAFADRPLLGWGPDNFEVAYPRYREAEATYLSGPGHRNNSAHSWLLQSAATNGVLGVAMLVAIIATSIVVLVRRLPSEPLVAGVLLSATVAYWSAELVGVGSIGTDWFAWTGFGGAVALTVPAGQTTARRAIDARAQVAVVIVAALLAATGINALLANGAAADARKAADLRNADVAAGEEAVRRDAGRADYWNELGRARFVARDWKGAEVAFLGAARRAPYNATYWGNLARTRAAAVQTKAGGTAADAIVAARRGIESDPSDPVPYATLADVALAVGENQVALAAAGEAIRLYTRAPSYDVVAAKAAAGMSDRAAARAMLEDIVRTKDSAVLRVALARICVELRDQSAARQNAQRALQLEPNNQEARAILDSLG